MLHFLLHCLLMTFVFLKLWCLSFWHDLYWSFLYYDCWRRQWYPTPVLLLGKSHGRRSLVGCRSGVSQSWTWLKQLSSSSSMLWLWLLRQLSSVQFSRSVSAYLRPHGLQHTGFPIHHQLLELAQTHVHRVSDAIQPSHPPFPLFSCLQSFPVSASFQMSHFFPLGGQSIGASASVLPMNIQDWFPLELTPLISLQSKGLSRVFSNTTVQIHQFFSAQLSLWSNSHIHTWLLGKP